MPMLPLLHTATPRNAIILSNEVSLHNPRSANVEEGARAVLHTAVFRAWFAFS